MNDKKNRWIILEVIAFFGIMLFCYGARYTKPQSVFSLQDALQTKDVALQLHNESVTVNLPAAFAKHLQRADLQAARVSNTVSGLMPSQLPDETITVDLSRCFEDRDSHMLFINLLSLHQQPSSYDIRIIGQNGKLLHQQSSGLLPEGEMMWRGPIGMVDLLQSPILQITTDQSGSKAFLCDVVIYDAPGMKFWDRDNAR